jgi:hypothetical protein
LQHSVLGLAAVLVPNELSYLIIVMRSIWRPCGGGLVEFGLARPLLHSKNFGCGWNVLDDWKRE